MACASASCAATAAFSARDLRVADDDERDHRRHEQEGEEHAAADGERAPAPRRARVEIEDRLQEVALHRAELAA